jgi:hypothetical protein
VRRRDGPKSAGGDGALVQRSLVWDILSGAFIGAVLGGVLLGVGVFGALSAILLGKHLAPLSHDDLRSAGYYLGSFTLAGAALGAAKPMLRTRTGTYVGFAVAGAFIGTIVMMAPGQGDAGGTSIVGNVIGGVGIGAVLGCAFAHGWLRVRD